MHSCFYVVYWSLCALARGVYPSTSHDGGALEATRQHLAGQPLGVREVVVDTNGD